MAIDPVAHWVGTEDITQKLSWESLFGNIAPIEVDLGAGDGSFIVERAQANPERNFLAVERLLGRARKISRRAARLDLTNLKVLRLESSYVLKWLIPGNSVAMIHLMFPDPWPKRRHWQRRIIQPEFVNDLAVALQQGGEFRFTTDHLHYFETGTPIVDDSAFFKRDDLWDFDSDPKTDFQLDFENEGRPIFRARWIKVAEPE